jgi:hypothetical protein
MATTIYTEKQKVLGYHGTYAKSVDGILQSNFKESLRNRDWLGDGVYFFVDGIGSKHPSEYALLWAIDEAIYRPDKNNHKEVVVLEANILINRNKFLDLTVEEGLKLFNEFRDEIIKRISKIGMKPSKHDYYDTDVLKIMKEELKIEIVKLEAYIRFGVQREHKLFSRVPNVTIFAVNNPTKNINRHSIKEYLRNVIV